MGHKWTFLFLTFFLQNIYIMFWQGLFIAAASLHSSFSSFQSLSKYYCSGRMPTLSIFWHNSIWLICCNSQIKSVKISSRGDTILGLMMQDIKIISDLGNVRDSVQISWKQWVQELIMCFYNFFRPHTAYCCAYLI